MKKMKTLILLMFLCATAAHPVGGFFLRYTEHETPDAQTEIPEVTEIQKCRCDGIIKEHFKSITSSDGVTTRVSTKKFPLAVPMFSSYGWGPQG